MVMDEKCIRQYYWFYKKKSNFIRLWRLIKEILKCRGWNWKDFSLSSNWCYRIKNREFMLRIKIPCKRLEKLILIWSSQESQRNVRSFDWIN